MFRFCIRPTAALSIIFSFVVLALCYSTSNSDAKSDPRNGWTPAALVSGACVTERDYSGFKLAIVRTAQKYAIVMSIKGKRTDIGRKYEGKLSFPATYENRIVGSGSEDNAVIFDDVFPTIFYSFSVKKSFTFYLDGYYYGPFDLGGSEKAIDDLNECKLGLTTAVSSAHSDEELFSYFSETDDPLETSITISPCTGEEVGECISHSLTCEKTSRNGPALTVIAGDIARIVSSLVVGTEGKAKAQLKLANGSSVDLPVNSIQVDPNELDGGWEVTIGLGTIDDFFDALTEANSEGAAVVVAGQRFSLAPRRGDGAKLVAWKDACIAFDGQSVPKSAPKPDCPFNSQLFRSPLYKDANPSSYQELQFPDGNTAGGKVLLTEYHEGKLRWLANGEYTCSNGFSICRVEFPLMLHGSVQLPFETVDNEQSQPEIVVIPSLSQEVYQLEQSGELKGKSHRGLVVDLQNGFTPTDDEVVAPYNVYRYRECAKSP